MDASISQNLTRQTHGGTLLLTSAIIAALGSFLFGFDTAVISGTTERLQELYSLSNVLKGLTVASALIGTLFGAFLVGRIADRWGRRPVLAFLAVFYLVSALGCAVAWDWWSLLFFRWLGGIGVGGASVVSPMYITEIAPSRRRGLLVAVSQLNIVVGILAAYFSNYFVARVMGAEHPDAWRWMFAIEAFPAAAFLIASLRIPESPRWLVKQARRTEAEQVLARFGHENPAGEVADISESLASELSQGHQRLLQRKYLKPLLLAGMIAAFNQLDGINAVIYYTTDIFRMAGMVKPSALKQSVMIGMTNLVMTVLAMAVIDRAGRKSLLLAGSVTFVLSHALAAWVFHAHAQGWIVLVAMMGIVGSHAYSQGAVVWVCINELLPNAVRAAGSAASCFLIWLLCIGVTWGFPVVAGKPDDQAAAGTSAAPAFAFFAIMMVVQFVLVWKYLPETKGVSLEELQKRLGVED